MKIVIVSGGFDPIHSGHISYINEAAMLGDKLIVALNSDDWLVRKKNKSFMPFEERKCILENLKSVDEVFSFDDSDGSVSNALKYCKDKWMGHEIIFAKGGDRTLENIPKNEIMDGIKYEFGVGGDDKKNSSSWILREWKNLKEERQWGYYRVLHEIDGCKVKELTINPGKSISLQYHKERSEFWIISEGSARYNLNGTWNDLNKHDYVHIPVESWHQLENNTDNPTRIVEIQYGSKCIEEDIVRKDYKY